MDVNRTRQRSIAGAGSDAVDRPDDATGAGVALEVITTSEDARWAAVVARATEHDFHHLAGYHRVAEYRGEGRAALFAYRDGTHVIAVPLLLRPVDVRDPTGPQDATSVYGYAGPIASHTELPQAVIDGFQAALREELVRRRVVSVFSRLHPLLTQRHMLDGLGETAVCGPTVSVDLTLPSEEQWAGYSKGTRRLIRRASEAGIVCAHDRGLDRLAEWSAIYRETMQRVGASAAYYFDDAYFDRLKAELGSVLHLFVASHEGRLAAAGLFTLCDGIVQAHLGASRAEYAALSPARLVDDTARRWAADAGARVFHLGGGVGGQEDGLFQYKAGFSGRRHDFAVWRWVVDERMYEELCTRLGRTGGAVAPCGSGQFFPAYRRPADPDE
jgi:hypothetical protein